VFCAITHDGNGQLLNTNADTITSQVAVGMSNLYKTSIYYCFELNGVLKDINDKDSLIKHIDSKVYARLLQEGIIANGMLPKLENCFEALNHGVSSINMGNTAMLTQENDNFTTITL
jgi:acetylglutamate kinase